MFDTRFSCSNYFQFHPDSSAAHWSCFEIFTEIFAWGFPSEDGLNKVWEEQKVNRKDMSSDNLLDYPKAGLSLFKDYADE